jgi:serine/threonine protein kinase
MQVTNKKGQRMQLQQDIAGGGEARIWTVRSRADMVAKVYHAPTPEAERKIQAMVAKPPDQPWKHKAIAWPGDVLYQGRQFVGFLMPKVEKSSTIFNYYNPVKRKKLCPGFNWHYLHRTAMNLAIAAEAIHAKGHIIGDVNESNILVNDNALVTLVDTDSFQIIDQQGRVHRCTVGKAEYTPPELQGVSFKAVDRQVEHDLFGLAVLIFHLLMEGVHPFAGILTSQMSVGRVDLFCIKQGLFSYHGANPDVTPPRNALPFAILHPEIQQAFVRCFVHGHQASSIRPSAREWKQILDRVDNSLVTCSANPQHVYSSHLQACPWCNLQQFRQQPSALIGQQRPLPSAGSQPTVKSASSAPKVTPGKRSAQPQKRTAAKTKPRPTPTTTPSAVQPAAAGQWHVPLQWTGVSAAAWIFANLILTSAYGAGWNLTMQVYTAIGRTPTQAILGVLFGAIIGLGQWLVLRRQFPESGWWVPATMASCGAIWAINWQIDTLQGAALGGAVAGSVQWLVLQRKTHQSGWWLLISPGAWTAGKFASLWTLQHNLFPTLSANANIISPGIQGLVYGLLTGITLPLLLRRLKP